MSDGAGTSTRARGGGGEWGQQGGEAGSRALVGFLPPLVQALAPGGILVQRRKTCPQGESRTGPLSLE